MNDRVIIVTGGNSGIGRAAALQFAREGAMVLITGRRANSLSEVEAEHPNVHGIVADVTDETSAERVVRQAVALWGRLDVLINNAGAFGVAPLEQVDSELVTKLMKTNVLGPTLMAQAALPYLKERQGSIVNVSSTYGHKPAKGAGHYAATKAALESLTQSWALELAPYHIRVNAVAPGPTQTTILERSGLSKGMIESIKARESEQIPLARQGTPEEVAEWILALSRPGASWITGQILSVDGGLSVA